MFQRRSFPLVARALAPALLASGLLVGCGGGGSKEPDVVEPEAEVLLPSLLRTSPRAGAVGVGTERPIVFDFSESLDIESVTADAIFATVGGEVISGTPIVEGDGERVYLFFTSTPLPAGSAVLLTVDGDLLTTRQGELVDADLDGEEGGVLRFEITTLPQQQVEGTEVSGRILASEPDEDGGERPLEGVVVSVDGLGDAVAVTDVDGRFVIPDAPAGKVFLRIDGGPTENAEDGFEYAIVERSAEAKPGQATDLGTVYLPVIDRDGYRFPKAGPHVMTEEQLALVPDSSFSSSLRLLEAHIEAGTPLFEDDGTVGGKFAISGSPAGRPPGFIPPELELPMLGVLQTNGRHRFQHLVGVTLPNLPPPGTNKAPAKDAKTGLWYYDAEVGRFELLGPMTVSSDARSVTSDEGIGLPGPGWFGASRSVQMTLAGTGVGDVACTNTVPGSDNDGAWTLLTAASSCTLDIPGMGAFEDLAETRAALQELADDLEEVDDALRDGECGPAGEAVDGLEQGPVDFAAAWTKFSQSERIDKALAALRCSVLVATEISEAICEGGLCVGEGAADLCAAAELLVGADEALTEAAALHDSGLVDLALAELVDAAPAAAAAIDEDCGKGKINDTRAAALRDDVQGIQAMVADVLAAIDALGSAAALVVDAETSWTRLVEESLPAALVGSGGLSRAPWRLTVEGEERTGRTDMAGALSVAVPPETDYELEVYVHRRRTVVRAVGTSPAPGERGTFGPLLFEPLDPDQPDTDGDGVPNPIENLIGSNPAQLDTDGDGRPDGLELYLGHDPLTRYEVEGEILTEVETAGPALDVAARGDLVVVAEGAAGIQLFGAADRFELLRLADLDTPGSASQVALDEGFAVVADGLEGLAIVDVSRPAQPELTHQLALGASVTTVAADAGLAFAGLDNNAVVSIDLRTGGILGQVFLDGPVLDLSLSGGYLYALTTTRVHAIQVRLGLLLAGASHASPAPLANVSLFAGQNTLFAVHAQGANTFSLNDPGSPQLLGHFTGVPAETGWRQLIPNGSGLALGLVGPNPGNTFVRSYALIGGLQEPIWIDNQNVQTPGNPLGMDVEGGIAFVADADAGLQVLAPIGFDTAGVAPTVELTTVPAPGVIEEGQVVRATAIVGDDVQVSTVEFLLNDRLYLRDGSYPFEVTLIAPLEEEERDFRLRARAIDSGGLVVESGVSVFDLQPDTSAPSVLSALPAAGTQVEIGAEVTLAAVLFDEPMDLATLLNGGVDVLSSGPDFQLGTDDDVVVTPPSVFANGTFQSLFFVFTDPLAPDRYRIRVRPTASDLSGNMLGAESASDFTVLGIDSDGDGLFDSFETNVSGTDPFDADTDNDGLDDGDELLIYGTDPNDPDFDDDGIFDGVEIAFGTDVFSANPSTIVKGKVQFAGGGPVPGASAHVEDAAVVAGNKVVSFITSANQNGDFAFASKWPTGPHSLRVEVRFELPSTKQVYFGFSEFFVPVAGGETNVGTIEIVPVAGSRGLDFVGAFLTSPSGFNPEPELWLTAEEATTARISFAGVQEVFEIEVPAGPGGTSLVLPGLGNDPTGMEPPLTPFEELEIVDGVADGASGRAFHVRFDGVAGNVFARAGLGAFFSSDTATILPRHMLGTRHRISSFSVDPGVMNLPSQFAVVASVNDTVIEITPSVDTEGRPAGVPFTVELDRLQVFHLATSLGDLTGTLVVANKSVAVLSGHRCALIPLGSTEDCDILVEQVPARRSTWDIIWGQDFFTVPLATREGGDLFRIQADEQFTLVTIDGPTPIELQLAPGQWTEVQLEGLNAIRGTKPVLVTQLARGKSADPESGTGGPFSMLLADRKRHLEHYSFHVPDDANITEHFVNVVIRSTEIDSLELDGEPLEPGDFESEFAPIGTSNLVGAQIRVTPGPHVIETVREEEDPPIVFGLSIYGFGAQESYGYPGSL